MNICKLWVFALLLPGTIPVFADTVIFNEIMYHNTPGVPEQNSQEWVEFYNRGTNAINLNGWRISKGVQFTFPNVTIPAGGYLVVAASTNAFSARYPGVVNVVGNWVGILSNNGDTLEL